MDEWHLPIGETCHVCLAGSVMAFSLDADIAKHSSPSKYNEYTHDRLRALNYLRTGAVDDAAFTISLDCNCYHLDRDVSAYSDDPEEWHADMEKLAEDLKEAGL